MKTPARADVVIIGSGHNGLVAAILLARAGLSVVVLEAAGVIGGATRTEYPFGKVPERERVARDDQRPQSRQLRQREADGREACVDAALEVARGVQNIGENRQPCRRRFAYSTTAHTSSLVSSLLNAGILGSLRPFHTL